MNTMKILTAAVAAFPLSGGIALANGGAIANSTTTSMAAPVGSPGMASPRSAVVPGLSTQQK